MIYFSHLRLKRHKPVSVQKRKETKMGDRLIGKNAIVTGAGRGVFKEVALIVAEEGANVPVVDPDVARGGEGATLAPADEVVQEIKNRGGEATACYESVALFDTAEKIIKTCVDTYGRLDILINGAGILRERPLSFQQRKPNAGGS
jgi:NAD(P)-dependent dehydrogenase (short-subunit alcohol dehydrogenase family)